MTARLSLDRATDIDLSRACELSAEQAYAELAEVVRWLEAQPDKPGLRIHSLFARLYLYVTQGWLKKLESEEQPEFLNLFVARFLDVYFSQVIDSVKGLDGADRGNWIRYFRRTDKLTMRSNIFSHLIIVVSAFKTHICLDMPTVLHHSTGNFQKLFERCPVLDKSRTFYLDPANRDLMLKALLDFITFHQAHESAFRRFTLGFFVKLVGVTSAIWWPVLNGWRKKSWTAFEKNLVTGI